MSFTPVSQERARGDAVNQNVFTALPPRLLTLDRKRWLNLAPDRSQDAEQANSLAAFFSQESERTIRRNQENLMVAAIGLTATRFQHRLLRVSAAHAISRLAGVLFEADMHYSDASDEYRGTPDDKFLVDYDENDVREGAHSLVVSKRRLAVNPFEGGMPDLSEGPVWYENGEAGLYVAVQSPAVVTDSLMDGLTISTGSRANAKAVIDAGNSVTLSPYLSLSYLRTPSRWQP